MLKYLQNYPIPKIFLPTNEQIIINNYIIALRSEIKIYNIINIYLVVKTCIFWLETIRKNIMKIL